MITEYYIWYGLKIGLTYIQTLYIPFGMLCDLIAIEQLKHEGAKIKKTDEDEFLELMTKYK